MGLESASYPNQLVATNPTGSDPKSTADDHIRLLKSVIQTTFPNLTGAMTAAQADLNKVGVTQPQTSNDTSVSSTAFVQTAVAAAITAIGAGASMWVSGTTYALGNVVWSPSNYQTYRRIIAGAGTTDPASDATNWVLVSGNVQTTATQTLTNKTLTSPVISTISNTGTLTLPTTTDTLVGRATTDTLTNKTLDAPVITGGASISGNVSVAGTGAFSGTLYMPQNNLLQWNSTGASGGTNRAVIWGDSSGNLNFGNGSGNATSVTIDTSGNLVVGSASALLTTAGRGNITVNGAGSSLLAFGVGGAAIGYISAIGSNLDVVNNSTGALRFYTNSGSTQAGQFDASGNLLVGAVGGSSHVMKKASAEGNCVLEVGSSTTGYRSALFYTVAAEGWSGSDTALYLGKSSSNGRSINAGGTVNQSGADYAEYERNNGTKFAKGQVVGFKEDGTLTDVYADAIRFGVKSTNPGLVGGDSWGAEKQVGKRPDEPQFAAPEYQGQQDPGVAPIEPVQQTLPEAASDEDKAKTSDDFASAHAEWVTASADYEKLAYEYRAAQAGHEARVEIAKHIFDTETYPEYQRALAEFEARLEAERQIVDRIAYCGKVPVAVYDATPGGYIIADKDHDGKIIGRFVAAPDFAQYKKAVGRVNRIMDAEASTHLVEAINGTDPQQFVGMAEIAVIVH